jgi:hypothetical protein
MEATMQTTTANDRKGEAARQLEQAAYEAVYYRLRHERSGAHEADAAHSMGELAAAYRKAMQLGVSDAGRVEAQRSGRDRAHAELRGW